MTLLVSVIIPTRNRPADTLACVQTIRAQNYSNIALVSALLL